MRVELAAYRLNSAWLATGRVVEGIRRLSGVALAASLKQRGLRPDFSVRSRSGCGVCGALLAKFVIGLGFGPLWPMEGCRHQRAAMCSHDPIVIRQLPVIQKIIADETWLEGERRGCFVPPTDPVVRENVCRVVLRIGAELRASLTRALAAEAA